MKHIITAACIILLTTLCISTSAEVFKHVDKNGQVSFSDNPKDKTDKKIDVTPTNNIKTIKSRPQGLALPAQAPDFRIAITSPSNGTVYRPPLEPIAIRSSVSPSLPRGYKIEIRHNGTAMNMSGNTAAFTEYGRGEHNFTAYLYAPNGELLTQSPPVTINVQIPFVRSSSS